MLEVDERRQEQLYRRAEVTKFLRVSDATLDRLILRGELETIRLRPRMVRVPQSSVLAFRPPRAAALPPPAGRTAETPGGGRALDR
jgi:predicted DNA-binding transcriptional regulator AlpA